MSSARARIRHGVDRAVAARRTSKSDWSIACHAALLTLTCAPSLRLRGFYATERLLGRVRFTRRTPTDPGRVIEIARPVIDVLTPGAACLHRSLVARELVLAAGHDAELIIGARRGAEGVEFHAWVIADGAVVNDDPDVVAGYGRFDLASVEGRSVGSLAGLSGGRQRAARLPLPFRR